MNFDWLQFLRRAAHAIQDGMEEKNKTPFQELGGFEVLTSPACTRCKSRGLQRANCCKVAHCGSCCSNIPKPSYAQNRVWAGCGNLPIFT